VNLRSVAVLGGGPGGLYAARLLKLHHPQCRVDLYEQSPPELTFGFGVGLATRTQRNLDAADPATLRDIVEASWAHEMSMAAAGRRVHLPIGNLIAIGRSRLLDILRHHADSAGVHLHYGTRVDAASLDAELIVAADGISSATREARAEAFGAHVDTHASLYLWCGAGFALPSAVFLPVDTEFGTFVAHAYPYALDRSTFLVETDPETWRRAGFDSTTDLTPADANDETSLAYLSEVFAKELRGQALIGNRTRWTRFRTVTCDRWHADNVVLVGDAAHTAHYSIGSGTKLAMEDGIALAAAIAEAPDLPSAFEQYERIRRPAVEHLQDTARRSMRWWDTFPDRLDMPLEQLLIAYMTRGGKVTVDRFAAWAGDIVRRGLAQYGDCSEGAVPETQRTEWIFSRPLTKYGQTWFDRRLSNDDLAGFSTVTVNVYDPWGAEGDKVIKDVANSVGSAQQSRRVVLETGDTAGEVLTMLDMGERLRREAEVVVAAHIPGRWSELAASALASGRIDLVQFEIDQPT